MQHERRTTLTTYGLSLALSACACSTSPMHMSYSQDAAPEAEAAAEPNRFELFTTDPLLYDASLRALQRIDTAIGDPGLALADPAVAERCKPFEPGCGFELSAKDVVYCVGDPDPAKACTSLGGGGKTLGIAMQAQLTGDELENRLIHEFFHVITLSRAPHSRDGLFMEYSVGDERISAGTLEAVCGHFACTRFAREEEPGPSSVVQNTSAILQR